LLKDWDAGEKANISRPKKERAGPRLKLRSQNRRGRYFPREMREENEYGDDDATG